MKPLNNYEYLIQKSPEELAKIFSSMCESIDVCGTHCPFYTQGCPRSYDEKKWEEWMLDTRETK